MGLDMWLYEKQVHEVAYWRKANAIHGWIINHVNAVDDCTPIELRKEDIIKLRDICVDVLTVKTSDYAQEILPPTGGFFFGSTEVNEYYWADLEDTVVQLTRIIDESTEDALFEYQASW